jgi:hypothetical protein
MIRGQQNIKVLMKLKLEKFMILKKCSELSQEFSQDGRLLLDIREHAIFKQAQTASHCHYEI